MNIFDHFQQEIIEVTFSFPEFVTADKKTVDSIYPLLGYSQY